MEMQFFWIGDKIAQEMYALNWHPEQENLANYQSKHHAGSHHVAVRPWYLHSKISPRVLPMVVRSRILKGCVGTLKDGYICKVPLLRAPQIQHASQASHVTCNTCYLAQVPRIQPLFDVNVILLSIGTNTRGCNEDVPLHGPPQAEDVGDEPELHHAHWGEFRDQWPCRLARPL
jgi:hypothetical protein